MENVYVLNYIVNRQIRKERGKMVTIFIDLRAASDMVDKGILLKAIRERGVREGLVERIGEIMEETKSRVRVGREWGESFWTARGVRQGYPLNPLLFNL